jgi:predicted dehydrogenase
MNINELSSFMKLRIIIFSILIFVLNSCNTIPGTNSSFSGKDGEVKIIQLDPTHSHAAAVQNEPIRQIDTNVFVYCPEKSELSEYFLQINSFNTRKNNPTRWNEVVYSGKDFLEKMVREKKGNVVVLAGNNRIKIDYIEQSINAGMNVFSDKPMVIEIAGFERLKNAYEKAGQKGVLMFDMMTERYNLINVIQRSLMQDTLFFGKIQKGTRENPAIMESSVHHYYRGGRGTRPYWFFDVLQQGEGIVDVTTHLIDLTFWKSFPDEIINYKTDVKVLAAKHWPVNITKSEFCTATSMKEIPGSLKQYLRDSVLEVFANGSVSYQMKGVYAGVKVEWRAATPTDGNDLRSAYARGTKATIIISQKYGQKRPKLYLKKAEKMSEKNFQYEMELAIARLQTVYPVISMPGEDGSAEIVINPDLGSSNDPTFRVFLDYLVTRKMPEWEIPNTLAKYYITTTALEMAK